MKISVQDAGFSYDGSNFVWQHINLDIPEGECFCLLGPNGCGKTTLFNCINGSYGLKQGRVLVNGKDVRDYSRSLFPSSIRNTARPFPIPRWR